jgi:hypothetical protein
MKKRYAANATSIRRLSKRLAKFTPLPPDNIERTAGAFDGLVKNDIVLKRVGPRHIIIVRIFCPPNNAGGTVLDLAMALNFISTKPSLILVSFLRSSG